MPVAHLTALVSVDALCRRARARGSDTEWVPFNLAGDLVPRTDLIGPATKSDALARLDNYLAANPRERGTLVVIASLEAA